MKPILARIVLSALIAAALTGLALGGALYRVDNMAADALYQRPGAASGQVVVIGIDAASLEELGVFPWPRDVLAAAIENLNADEANRPAAIGVDVLFVGETSPAADAALVAAAGQWGNVVVATSANYAAQLVEGEDGAFAMDPYAIAGYDEPFPALAAVTGQGHINAMLDEDGYMRHGLLAIDLPGGARVPAFHEALYQMYARAMELDPGDAPPTGERHSWYIDFTAEPGYFSDGVSVADLVAGNIPAGYTKDKIVLIGPYASGMMDYTFTPIARAELMYGVEFQANAIENLLNGQFKKEAGSLWQALVLFALCFFCALMFYKRRLWVCALAWVALCLGWLGLCLAAYGGGLVLHPLWVPLALTVLFVAAVAVNYLMAAREKRKVTDTFKKYVAPEIVNEILKEGTDVLVLGGKMSDIAVLFVDIRGFTPMSEELPPEEVVAILNRYLELTSACIMRHKGTLDKFVGDATMAFWGAPLPQEDPVYRAVCAALDMVEGSRALNEELLEKSGRTVGFGIGVHCGPAVVGNIGAPMRMDYTAIGDTVNTAARLESNAPSGKIYISRAVADALAGRVAARSLGDSVRLKGKAEGFEVLELEGLTEGNQP